MKRTALLFVTLLTILTNATPRTDSAPWAATAQMADPVHFTAALKMLGDGEAEIVFTGKMEAGWHVYSTDLGKDGPIEATFNAVRMDGAETVGRLQARGNVIKKYDRMFDMELKYFEQTATFVQKIRFTKPQYAIDGYLEYGACNDEMCLPPTQVDFKQQGTLPPTSREAEHGDTGGKGETAAAAAQNAPEQGEQPSAAADQEPSAAADRQALTADAAQAASPTAEQTISPAANLWHIFLGGLLGGLLALLTPCVWPIIPMTVSFFLKRNKQRAGAIREAVLYGLSIIVIYVALGLLVTLAFGANALNALSTNAWFNIFFALLLALFAASFLGAFELTLPSSWSTRIDAKSERTTGLLSIFLMAFTLALVSFSCTGPIIGFLLVAVSTQGSILGPTVGMLGFSVGLAVPFALFALFPSLLKSAPKSGGWMNTVKVTLAFIELAFALKFLSVADLAYGWRLLDREVFLSLWIALFGLLAAYLFGWLRFPHDEPEHRTNVPQFFLGLVSLAFTVYMIPGLWGAPLKVISAFTPPMFTQDFRPAAASNDGSNGAPTVVEAHFRDFDAGMAEARRQHKPVVVDFTGFGCVNCRKMEAAVWTDPGVARRLTNDYILISLYVDDKTPLPQPVEVTVGGRQRTLRTVGDRWSHLQATRFGANTQPFYILLDNDGRPLSPARSYDEDAEAYLQWLDQGLEAFGK
ncbi:MAG: thioredoxin family protein [Prevotella sp.]|nr:thioredoxin family protein [Prevotella sp.]